MSSLSKVTEGPQVTPGSALWILGVSIRLRGISEHNQCPCLKSIVPRDLVQQEQIDCSEIFIPVCRILHTLH